MHGSGQKRGVLDMGQARKMGGLRHGSGQKGGLYRGTYLYGTYMLVPPPGINHGVWASPSAPETTNITIGHRATDLY